MCQFIWRVCATTREIYFQRVTPVSCLPRKAVHRSVAKFIVPDWRDKVNSGIGLAYRMTKLHIGWRDGTTTLCMRSQLYPPVKEYEFGYWRCFYVIYGENFRLNMRRICVCIALRVYKHCSLVYTICIYCTLYCTQCRDCQFIVCIQCPKR
jgi:hypothetical protein